MKFENGQALGKFQDLHPGTQIRRLPETGTREWWVPLNDSSAGALCSAGEKSRILDIIGDNRARDMAEQIALRAPERVSLPYNGFHAASCRSFIAFLGAVWANRAKIRSSFALFVPRDSIFCGRLWKAGDFESEDFRPIRMDRSSASELRPPEEYIDCGQPEMPFFDLDAKEFDLVALYDFCCRKLAYIIKTGQLFPRLDSGMTDFNTCMWQAFPGHIHCHWNLGTEYNELHGQALRLWKLADEDSLKKAVAWLPLDPFCRGRWDDLCWSRLFPISGGKIKRNTLAEEICQEETYGSEHRFLFPLALLLGHCAEYEHVRCCIPEYNFHELIRALILTIEGREIPELLPDIPGEEEISLEAYRRGVLELPPACKNYGREGDRIIAEFKNGDTAYGFIEKIHRDIDGEFCFADGCGNIVFRNVADPACLLDALEEAKTTRRVHPIEMRLLDGSELRKMSLRELLVDSAARIVRHFPYDHRDALRYLAHLSEKFKNRYQRCSVVR